MTPWWIWWVTKYLDFFRSTQVKFAYLYYPLNRFGLLTTSISASTFLWHHTWFLQLGFRKLETSSWINFHFNNVLLISISRSLLTISKCTLKPWHSQSRKETINAPKLGFGNRVFKIENKVCFCPSPVCTQFPICSTVQLIFNLRVNMVVRNEVFLFVEVLQVDFSYFHCLLKLLWFWTDSTCTW